MKTTEQTRLIFTQNRPTAPAQKIPNSPVSNFKRTHSFIHALYVSKVEMHEACMKPFKFGTRPAMTQCLEEASQMLQRQEVAGSATNDRFVLF